jgi:putative phage-type endonuclease
MEDKIKTILEKYGQNDQRTEAWHQKRGQMLTASEIYKALPEATPAQRYELIMSKLTPKPVSNGPGAKALIWGTRFEPIAKDIYKSINYNHIDIVDTTCIPHPTVEFLGASPDGIIIASNKDDFRYGKLVEFKCPISRKFTNESPIPDAYYHQMQLQLECTELEECIYIEMEFKELNYSEWLDSKATYKSLFVIRNDNTVVYRDISDSRDVSKWMDDNLPKSEEEFHIIYWVLNTWREVTVKKDSQWLKKNLPSFQSAWTEIQEYRKSGSLPQNPKDKNALVL